MALSVVATAAARSSTRSLVAVAVCRSLPYSNQKATAMLESATAAAVTAISCTASVRGQNLKRIAALFASYFSFARLQAISGSIAKM